MIGIAPKNKSAFVNMLNRIGFLVLFIILLIVIYIPNFTIYGGVPFSTYGEATRYFFDSIWQSLVNGNVLLLPLKLIFLPFLSTLNCSRPGCESFELLFFVVYYTFWFYLIAIIKFKNKN